MRSLMKITDCSAGMKPSIRGIGSAANAITPPSPMVSRTAITKTTRRCSAVAGRFASEIAGAWWSVMLTVVTGPAIRLSPGELKMSISGSRSVG